MKIGWQKLLLVFLIQMFTWQSFGQSHEERLARLNDREEAAWRYTELTYQFLDNVYLETYCKKNEIFYLGCVAGLEELSKALNFQNEVRMTDQSFDIVINPELTLSDEYAQSKAFELKRRQRFQAMIKTFSSQKDRLQTYYTQLKSKLPNPAPYQIAAVMNAIESVIYDVHTRYEPAFKYNASRITRKNAIIGIRFLKLSRGIYIDGVVPGLPAELAGIKAGDYILKADGQNVSSFSETAFDNLLDKPLGGSVELVVQRENRQFIARPQFVAAQAPEYVARVINFDGKNYSYLQFPDFMNTQMCKILSQELKKAQKNAHGLILDLRNNGGGYKDLTPCVLGSFIGSEKIILFSVSLTVNQGEYTLSHGSQIYKHPVVVLVNASTASAAEIVAGNLQAHGRGFIIGTPTKGKGTEQDVSRLHRFNRYQTTRAYYLGNGVSPQLTGITPNLASYVNPTPLESELHALREADIGIFPLAIPKRQFAKAIKSKPLSTPSECLNQKNVHQIYENLSLSDWTRDLQVLNGLAYLSCQQ